MKNFLLAVFFLSGLVSSAQQINKQLTASNGRLIGFLEYKPTDYEPSDTSKKYPLIIFLHGMGEKGNGTTDLYKVKYNGIPKYINAGHPMRFYWNGKWETFLVLSPQLSTDYSSWPPFYIAEMLQYARKNLHIDTNRVVLTGLSLGGGGVWYYSAVDSNNTRKLAAIGAVCGTKKTAAWSNIAKQHLPTWAFHATDDTQVPVYNTNSIVQVINDAKPAVAPYKTIWPTGGHAIWDRAFDTVYKWQNPNIYEWFLAQNKSLPVNTRPVARGGSDTIASVNLGTITLNAGSSMDTDGTIQRYIWRQIAGPATVYISNAVSVNGICSISKQNLTGIYQYEVKVVDDRADYTLDTVAVNVISNFEPVANAGSPIVMNQPSSSTKLNGSGSSDPDGTLISYKWSQVAGPSPASFTNETSAIATVSSLQVGTYTFRLLITDSNLAQDSSEVEVTINASTNIAPTAKSGNDDTLYLPSNFLTVDGSTSYDKDGNIISYKWVKLSGPATYTMSNPEGVTNSITNLVAGTYKFRLIVYDNKGDSGMDNHYIVVKSTITTASATKRAPAIDAPMVQTEALKAFPNPTAQQVTVRFRNESSGKVLITLYSITGQPVKTAYVHVQAGMNSTTLDLQSLTKGIYELEIRGDHKKPQRTRIIRN